MVRLSWSVFELLMAKGVCMAVEPDCYRPNNAWNTMRELW
jgi:hypothetical protein